MKNIFDIKEKNIVITGGLGQLGLAYVKAFESLQANVVIIDVADRDKGLDVLNKEGVKAAYYKADITKEDEVQAIKHEIHKKFPQIDVLINNAALDSPPNSSADSNGPFEKYSIEVFEQIMSVNCKDTLICCKVFGAEMAEKENGSIINIGSIYGMVSPKHYIYDYRHEQGEEFYKPISYSVSKGSLYNLTRYLATYWGKKNVRVNCVSLAGVFNHQDSKFMEAYLRQMPLGRMATPQDYIGPMIFLASSASQYMTGANLVVDGGWTSW